MKKVNITINLITPLASWPADSPPYLSPEGWELEKKMALDKLRKINTINWFLRQTTNTGNPLYSRVAFRLLEIERSGLS